MSLFFRFFRFENILQALVILLPFTTILSVFTKERLGIPGVTYYKEILILILAIWVIVLHIQRRVKFQITIFDVLIGLYILYLVSITIFTTGIQGIIYGGRYDFSFLITLLIALHGSRFLEQKVHTYIKLFLISGGVALVLSLLIRFVLSEDFLLYLGFSGNPSSWQFGGSIPIFHGVDGASVRRFQGILDGPNTMGAFLLIYMGMLAYYTRLKKDWYFLVGIILFGLIGLIVLTYSRSALVGLIGSVFITAFLSLGFLWRHYKIQVGILSILFFLFLGAFFVKYGDNTNILISRAGSTQGHFERIITGFERFKTAPFGQGLGSSGPAYRYIYDVENRSTLEMESLDRFYIPESWYVQQLIEGGVFGAGIFAFLFLFLLISLYRVHPIWFATFLSISIMNLFLHTFESSTISLILFLFLGLILGTHHFRDFMYVYDSKK